MADEDGGTFCDTPGDKLGDGPVVELRIELVLNLSEVLVAEDTESDDEEDAQSLEEAFETGFRSRKPV